MKRTLTAERAAELKMQGITHVASIMKSHFATSYFKYESIDEILENGGKMHKYGYKCGINGRHIDWNVTIRCSEI